MFGPEVSASACGAEQQLQGSSLFIDALFIIVAEILITVFTSVAGAGIGLLAGALTNELIAIPDALSAKPPQGMPARPPSL